jgi:signal transduction histidine kinase/CheY-like chemotaxis protein
METRRAERRAPLRKPEIRTRRASAGEAAPAGGQHTGQAWLAALIACIGLFAALALVTLHTYESSAAFDSAAQLTELNRQAAVNVETTIRQDMDLAGQLADELAQGEQKNEAALVRRLQLYRSHYPTDVICLYNTAGQCLQVGQTVENGVQDASFVAQTRSKGVGFRLLKTTMEYCVPVKSSQLLRGTEVTAVSVVRDLGPLVNNMGYRPFGGNAAVFLMDRTGVRISQSAGSQEAYNVLALFGAGEARSLAGSAASLEDAAREKRESVFLYHSDQQPAEYLAMTPVGVPNDTWYILTAVPQKTVNQNSAALARELLAMSCVVILAAAGLFYALYSAYRRRMEQSTAVLRSREVELSEALAMANSANLAKTRFLSSMSHDIRTPLNAIINMTQFLSENLRDEAAARREIAVIRDSSGHLLSLINDILDMSRIESGKVHFACEPFDLREVTKNVRNIIEPLCREKGQTLEFRENAIRHTALRGDALRLRQVLINLLNNAVKFTPEGGSITCGVSELATLKAGTVPFQFVVSDTGIGIPADQIATIFEPFTRVDTSTVRRAEGSGLGLAICKSYVEAQGGKIRVVSEEGRGSVFTVELYFQEDVSGGAPQQAGPDPDRAARFDGCRALLAEDNAINRQIAELLLTGWGFAVTSAADGAEAVRLFASSSPGTFAIVFMDIQMPVLDGYEAARRIRKLPRPDAAAVPILAMTANAFAEDVERARAAGMNAHVSKPIDRGELHDAIARLLGERES